MEKFSEGDKVKVTDLAAHGHQDWGMSKAEYARLLTYEGKEAVIVGFPLDNYCDVRFEDGYEILAISEEHLNK